MEYGVARSESIRSVGKELFDFFLPAHAQAVGDSHVVEHAGDHGVGDGLNRGGSDVVMGVGRNELNASEEEESQ
jgi:hypothetical protein